MEIKFRRFVPLRSSLAAITFLAAVMLSNSRSTTMTAWAFSHVWRTTTRRAQAAHRCSFPNHLPSPDLVSTKTTAARKKFFSESSSSEISSVSLFMTTVDEDEIQVKDKSVDQEWNVAGLKKEVQRAILRCHKKVGKANKRLTEAKEVVDQLTNDENASLQQLEACPSLDALEVDLKELKTRLQSLNRLEGLLFNYKNKNLVLPEEVAALAIDLGVDDRPQPKPERGPPKEKGPSWEPKSRRPYRRYYSFDNIEIRVGKKAEDNDQLSLSPKHRDGSDWWMHASGCPGSHVVIRCGDETLPKEVIADAAALAARQSKCSGSVIKVSLTRCRDIKKPPGAKPGLVQLTGKVQTISVNMNEAEARLERLETTVRVN